MSEFFKQKRAWIIILFLLVSIAGLIKINSVLEHKKEPSDNTKSHSMVRAVTNFSQFFTPFSAASNTSANNQFKVIEISPLRSRTEAGIKIALNQDVNLFAIKGYIEVSPKVDFIMEQLYDGIALKGNFQPGKAYKVEVLKSMPSEKHSTLDQSVKTTVFIPDYEPFHRLKVSGMYASLRGNQNIPIEVINLDAIKIKIHRIYDNNLIYLLKHAYYVPTDLGVDVTEKIIKIHSERNKPQEVLVNLKELIRGDTRGIFFVQVATPDSTYYTLRGHKLRF